MKIRFPNNKYPATAPEESSLIIEAHNQEEFNIIEGWYKQIIKHMNKLELKSQKRGDAK